MRIALWLFCAAALIATPIALFPVLPSTAILGKQADGFFLLPTSQLLKPWGQSVPIKGRPVDAAFDSAARVIAVANTTRIDLLDRSTGVLITSVSMHASSYTGIAFRPGDKELWVSETSRRGNDDILIIDTTDFKAPKELTRLELRGHAVPCGIAFTRDGKTAYVALSRNNSIAVFDAEKHAAKNEIDAGIAPFGVVVANSAGRVFVSNRGGRRASAGDTTAPTSGSAAVTDPVTGTTTTGTVTVVDMETLKTRELPVGLAPSGMALSLDESSLAIANGHSDAISVVDTHSLQTSSVPVPQYPEGLIGSQPIAAAWSPDGKRIYTACAGVNAIVALERKGTNWKTAGAIPTGWFPSAVLVDPEGVLHVVNIKGTGNTAAKDGSFNSRNFEGSVISFPAPTPAQLSAGLREVAAANAPQMMASGGVSNLPSLGIRHVFLIIKENRTYDQVFGDIGKGNSDPKYVMFGRNVTPNHHALAEKYVLLDNFFTGGAISFDGHQWLMQSFVSDYTERAFASSPRGYAWNMADALTVAPSGFFWQSLHRQPPSIRIYGEFCEPAAFDAKTQSVVDINEDDSHWTDYWKMYKDGTWRDKVRERTGVPAVASYFETNFPFNSTVVPDQMRADSFLSHFAEMEKAGEAPQLFVIALTADHTNGTQPGSPTPRAMVADDDLALGRIVEGISKSRFWKDSLILVVEDDAQNGKDHVDGHRTVALAIGPHVRRGAIDSNFYTHSGMIRTIQEIFRIPPQTRFVGAARAMNGVFTPEADNSPYKVLPAEIPLDEMNPVLKSLNGDRRWAAERSLAMDWTHPDEAPSVVLNRVLEIEARYRASRNAVSR